MGHDTVTIMATALALQLSSNCLEPENSITDFAPHAALLLCLLLLLLGLRHRERIVGNCTISTSGILWTTSANQSA